MDLITGWHPTLIWTFLLVLVMCFDFLMARKLYCTYNLSLKQKKKKNNNNNWQNANLYYNISQGHGKVSY